MIYAIVVTYNPEQALIDSQFESLVNQVDGVIYVDNASSNATVFPISEKVIILRNQVNEGLGRAQHQLIHQPGSRRRSLQHHRCRRRCNR